MSTFKFDPLAEKTLARKPEETRSQGLRVTSKTSSHPSLPSSRLGSARSSTQRREGVIPPALATFKVDKAPVQRMPDQREVAKALVKQPQPEPPRQRAAVLPDSSILKNLDRAPPTLVEDRTDTPSSSAPSAPPIVSSPLPAPGILKNPDAWDDSDDVTFDVPPAVPSSESQAQSAPTTSWPSFNFKPPVTPISSIRDRAGSAPLQKGVRSGAGIIARMPRSVFDGWDEGVPPGSHYEAWVWNAISKPGHITVELYLDGSKTRQPDGRPTVLERAYGVTSENVGPIPNPKCDLSRHVLISLPKTITDAEAERASQAFSVTGNSAGWGDLSRVMLVPVTYKKVEIEPTWSERKRHEEKVREQLAAGQKVPKEMEKRYEWTPDPAGITPWMANDAHHNAILGQIVLDEAGSVERQAFWVIACERDVRALDKKYFSSDTPVRDMVRFGYEGVAPTISFDERTRQRLNPPRVAEDSERTPVNPAARYLGHVRGKAVLEAILAAGRGVGPVIPHWPKEDVEYVKALHHGLTGNRQRKEEQVSGRSIPMPAAPRENLEEMLQPVQEDAPRNRMPMRAF